MKISIAERYKHLKQILLFLLIGWISVFLLVSIITLGKQIFNSNETIPTVTTPIPTPQIIYLPQSDTIPLTSLIPPSYQNENGSHYLAKDLSSIIAEWEPSVAYIQCASIGADPVSGKYTTVEFSGSGFTTIGLHGYSFITNKHVVIINGQTADFCTVKLPNHQGDYTAFNNPSSPASSEIILNENFDVAYLLIVDDQKSDYPFNQPLDPYYEKVAVSISKVCKKKAAIGDSIIILGYPAIGSSANITNAKITATRGIISGYDGGYYITDAKMDHGNSGGAAILIKNDCYLGMPTFAAIGGVESLGRILDAVK